MFWLRNTIFFWYALLSPVIYFDMCRLYTHTALSPNIVLPTKVILGVARTFLTVVVVEAVLAAVDVAEVVFAVAVAVILLVLAAITTGSVEGIGLPSFV